jgi:hypothetical protein
MDFSPADDDLDGVSPFDIDWGIELPKQKEAEYSADNNTPRVDEDDYSEEEVEIFKALKRHIRDACNVNTAWKQRKKALEWCFVRGEKDKHGFDFHNSCLALGARPEVILARLHHQFYVAGVPLREPLPLWIDPLPQQYESEAIMAAWEDGVSIVREVWKWPGIPIDALAEKSGIPDPFSVMGKLEKVGLIAWRFGFVFLTGRSTETVNRRTFSWSRSFF